MICWPCSILYRILTVLLPRCQKHSLNIHVNRVELCSYEYEYFATLAYLILTLDVCTIHDTLWLKKICINKYIHAFNSIYVHLVLYNVKFNISCCKCVQITLCNKNYVLQNIYKSALFWGYVVYYVRTSFECSNYKSIFNIAGAIVN